MGDHRKGSRQKVQDSPGAIPLDNRYTLLDTVVAEDWSGKRSNSSNCPASGVGPGSQRGSTNWFCATCNELEGFKYKKGNTWLRCSIYGGYTTESRFSITPNWAVVYRRHIHLYRLSAKCQVIVDSFTEAYDWMELTFRSSTNLENWTTSVILQGTTSQRQI